MPLVGIQNEIQEPSNIQISLFDDRLEIVSPGSAPRGLTISKIKEGRSKIRNPGIASVFKYLQLIEKWGTGIPRVIEECVNYGLKEPVLEDDGDFRVILYREKTDQAKITDQAKTTDQAKITNQVGLTPTKFFVNNTNEIKISCEWFQNLCLEEQEIIKVLYNDLKITQKRMAELLSWKLSKVKYYIGKLVKKGIIQREGTSQNGIWKVIK